MTSAGHLAGHLHRAIASGNLLAARALAAELPRPLNLDEALAVLVLMAEREPATFPRAAARFAGRLALERPVTITELEHAVATLVDLPAATAYAELGAICERHRIRPPPARRARSS